QQETPRDTTPQVQLDPIVVSASKRPEKALNAPARVEVIGERAVDERPAVSLTEHLRNVPGVDIATTGVQSSNVVARGFNNIFSGSLHFLTDNRIAGVPSLRVNLLHFVPTTNEDVARMEVVLGPGAALYGPNTANGILHVITKSPLDDPETAVSISGGSQDVFHGVFRTAHRLGENFGVKLSGQYFTATEFGYTDPAEVGEREKFASSPIFRSELMRAVGINEAEANTRIARIGRREDDAERWSGEARADWRITPDLTTIFSVGSSTEVSGVELTGLGAAQARNWRSTYYQARTSWNRLFAQVYLNTSDAGETFLLRNGAPIQDESRLLVGQLQHSTRLAERQSFTYGVDAQHTTPITNSTINGLYEDDDETREFGAYLQSETGLSDRFELTLAGRVDTHSALPDPVFSPRAALVFNPRENQAFRVSFNRAFSTPSSLNQFLDLGSPIPGADPVSRGLSQLGYSLRVQGTGRTGFRFRQADGGYRMRSPFTPAGLGGPGQLLPANQAALFFPAAVAVVARTVQLPPSLVAYLSSLRPTPGQIGTNFFNPVDNATGRLADLQLNDVDPIRESIDNTFEVGYKGILGSRLLLAADVWRSRRENLVTPLTIQTPLLTLNPQQLGAYLVTRFMTDLRMPQAQAVALATQLTGGLARVPLGVVSSEDVHANGAQLLVTYTNVDEAIDLWGTDLSATALLTDQWSVSATASFVNDDAFETESVGLVTLNAPKRKGSLSVLYRNDDAGFNGELRARYNDAFPVNSGVYIGTRCLGGQYATSPLTEDCVESYTLMDLTLGYRIPRVQGTSLQLTVQNLLDEEYRSFPGAPDIGRLARLRLKYEF
ncbi:MAG: TonB-dependent receptor, partial [Gemmatimonadota bacterium]|nr:TonB-dependent receptor [Gemmatimonadota bacterium]